ncbi:hypothetical protein KR009_000103 [Drosophila setifemur]|nr:hypothetical protein KR009_000103 [Drosophila setifemur]
MQYRACARLLPPRWILARNLWIVASSSSSFASPEAPHATSASAKMSDLKCESPAAGRGAVAGEATYQAGSSSVAYVTTPDRESARKLALGIIEHKLAACVNIVPQIESIYMWEGKVNEDCEYLLMVKTRTRRIDELSKFVREHHPYSVAEVISLPIQNGNLPYLKWIEQTVPDQAESKD